MKKFRAFTMAEAILVMTILGVIATVMITTMKPAQFKDQGYEILGKRIYGSLDSAITQILMDKAPYNTLATVYRNGSTTSTFAMNATSKGSYFIVLLKNYMATARGDVPTVCTNKSYNSYMLLKDGACLAVNSGSTFNSYTWIPGESNYTAATGSYGMIFLDTNGDSEPNVVGKDEFYIPLMLTGIVDGN